jgi:hypothetical protein
MDESCRPYVEQQKPFLFNSTYLKLKKRRQCTEIKVCPVVIGIGMLPGTGNKIVFRDARGACILICW